jgi:cellobiose phosphorylase
MAFALQGDHERAWELFMMINPVNRGGNPQGISTYKVEPYVVSADVYAVPPHVGRGGWTWYTGSAGWMYRLILETLLGLSREPERLRLTPRLPASWKGFKLHYRFRETLYHVAITKGGAGGGRTIVDGVVQADDSIPLVNDKMEHQVEVHLPA